MKKLAGIGIKIIPYLDALPDEVLEYAEELNLPIIDIHYSIPLSEIMMAVLKEIFNKQALLLEKTEEIHRRFVEIILEGQGIEEVMEAIYENVGNPIVLNLKLSNQVFPYFNDLENDLAQEILKDAESFYESSDCKYEQKKLYEDKILIKDKFITRVVMPIVLKIMYMAIYLPGLLTLPWEVLNYQL